MKSIRRVAYVCADRGVPVFGQKGCSVHVMEILRAFVRRGIDVTLYAARLGGEAPPDLSGVAVVRLPKDRADTGPSGVEIGRRRNATLQRAISTGRFDLVYERHALWSYAAMEAARDRGTPSVLEVNAPLVREHVRYRGRIDAEAATSAANRSFAAAGALVAVSREVALDLERNPSAAGRVHVVPNGVDVHRFRVRRTAGVEFTVGFVGTLKAWHGLPTLIDAFARLRRQLPGARLLIVGDGPERDRVVQQLCEQGLFPFTTLPGAVSPESIPGWLAKMDVGVAPYPDDPDFYFSPLKVMEYMAAGLPVVASRVGQLEQLIAPERTGLLGRPACSRALADHLLRLAEDPDLRTRLGAAAQDYVAAHHQWSSVLSRTLALARVGPARTGTESSTPQLVTV